MYFMEPSNNVTYKYFIFIAGFNEFVKQQLVDFQFRCIFIV